MMLGFALGAIVACPLGFAAGEVVSSRLRARRHRPRNDINASKPGADTHEAMLRSDERFASFMDNLPGIAVIKDREGRLQFLNTVAREVAGITDDQQWLNKTVREIFPREFALSLEEHDRTVFESGKPIQVYELIPQKDGMREYLMSKFCYRGPDGDTHLGGVGIDVTEHRRAEDEIKRQKRLLETVSEASPSGMLLNSTAGEWVLYNQNFLSIWKISDSVARNIPAIQLLERCCDLIVNPQRHLSRLCELMSNPDISSSETYKLVDGRTLVENSSPVVDDQGNNIGRVFFIQDITLAEQDKQQLRSLAWELARASESERRRIAGFLHDELGQMLSLASMKTQTLRSSAPHELDGSFAELISLLERVTDQSRSMTLQLSPPVLHELGFWRALRWLGSYLLEAQGLEVDAQIAEGAPPPDEPATVMFHAVREIFVNILKHSRASRVTVRGWKVESFLHVEVTDNGIGLDVERLDAVRESGGHFGLFNIREQMGYMNGTFEITSEAGRFTQVHLAVPLEAAAGASNA